MCAKKRLRSACALARSDHNLIFAQFGKPMMQSFLMITTDSNQIARRRRLIRVFVERIIHKERFLTLRFVYICVSFVSGNQIPNQNHLISGMTVSMLSGFVLKICGISWSWQKWRYFWGIETMSGKTTLIKSFCLFYRERICSQVDQILSF